MCKFTEAGKRGPKVRSDCWVRYEPKRSGGLKIELKSKVAPMYGTSIKELAIDVLKTLHKNNAHLIIEDTGALAFVIAARIETAVKRFHKNEMASFIPEMKEHCLYSSSRERFRRSRLYLPGNEPKFFLNAGLHNPDGIILDLEDSVAPSEKDAARIIVRNALRQVNFFGVERMVRINQLPLGLEDLKIICPHNVHLILIPKCETAQQVQEVESIIKATLEKTKEKREIFLMPIIESALGVFNALSIATASKSIVALTVGLEDYTADIGAERTIDGKESLWARSTIVNAARAAGIQPIDTVFSDVDDMKALKNASLEAKMLGFDGKGCIHPRQIPVINEAFSPSKIEIEKAKKIVRAFDDAKDKNLGVVSLGSKMIDPPIVKRAIRTIEMAIATELLIENWKDEP